MGYGRFGVWVAVTALSVLSIERAHAQSVSASAPVSISASEGANPSEADAQTPSLVPPVRLALFDEPESVYPPPTAPTPDEGYNAGSVNFKMEASYWTRYVYRGVDQTTNGKATENSLQFRGISEFDLGKLPHPFIGLFVNVFNNDPVSRFEEVRPFAGLKWTIKPLTIEVGYQNYLFPSRRAQDTQEVWASIALDDSRIFRTEKPIFSPYIYGAYDFELYHGFYVEAGIKHDFLIQDTGITLTPSAAAAYVISDKYFREAGDNHDTGLQHFEAGMTLGYNLNSLINIPRRYGQWRLKGYLFYTDGIENRLRADSGLYGGGGISFEY